MTERQAIKSYKAMLDSGFVRPALLSQRLDSGLNKCGVCQRRCVIGKGGWGYCHTVVNSDGELYTIIYGAISSAASDPIEKKPLFHFKPGSRCFSVGSLGCNFKCKFCQNWQIAFVEPTISKLTDQKCVTPDALVDVALQSACQGVAWTYNEPSIWLNYTLDCVIACKKNGLYTVYVTNGYSTPEALNLLGPYLDAYRVDIKSLNDGFYREMASVPCIKDILDVARKAKMEWGMHVECVTNLVPGHNDSDDNICGIATWICKNLGTNTPWHITRFFPCAELSDVPPTPLASLVNAVQLAKQAGLKFVYLGNVQETGYENTHCPRCGQIAIERCGYHTRIVNMDDQGRCASDGEALNVRV